MRSLSALFWCMLLLPFASKAQQQPTAAQLRASPLGQARRQRQDDSLQEVFYRAPPYVQLAYYHNAQEVPWSGAMTCFLQDGRRHTVLHPITGSTFLFPPTQGELVALGLTHGTLHISATLRTRFFTHGASVTFGFISRAYLTQQGRDTAEWMPIGQVLHSIDLATYRKLPALQGLCYLVVVPRVYGDGAVYTVTQPVFRHKRKH